MIIIAFILGFWIGFEIRKPAIGYCLRCHGRMLRRLEKYMLMKTWYKKKAGYQYDEEDPGELQQLLKKYQ
jgi:hypothetical protein